MSLYPILFLWFAYSLYCWFGWDHFFMKWSNSLTLVPKYLMSFSFSTFYFAAMMVTISKFLSGSGHLINRFMMVEKIMFVWRSILPNHWQYLQSQNQNNSVSTMWLIWKLPKKKSLQLLAKESWKLLSMDLMELYLPSQLLFIFYSSKEIHFVKPFWN